MVTNSALRLLMSGPRNGGRWAVARLLSGLVVTRLPEWSEQDRHRRMRWRVPLTAGDFYMRWLCWIGRHDWGRWHYSKSPTGQTVRDRTCRSCPQKHTVHL